MKNNIKLILAAIALYSSLFLNGKILAQTNNNIATTIELMTIAYPITNYDKNIMGSYDKANYFKLDNQINKNLRKIVKGTDKDSVTISENNLVIMITADEKTQKKVKEFLDKFK